MRITGLVAVVLAMVFAMPSRAESNISVSMTALEFTGVIQQNGKGAFDYFLRDLEQLAQVSHAYTVVPTARGAKDFFAHKSECIVPSSLYPPYFEKHDVIHSESFASVRYIAFTLADQAAIISKKQMAGKVIGVIRDEDAWDYEKRFSIPGATYIRVSNLESLVEMLYKERIDVAIHDHSDFLLMVQHLKRPAVNFNLDYPLAVDRVVISCHNSPKTRAYLTRMNPHIKSMVEKGLGKYYQMASIE